MRDLDFRTYLRLSKLSTPLLYRLLNVHFFRWMGTSYMCSDCCNSLSDTRGWLVVVCYYLSISARIFSGVEESL